MNLTIDSTITKLSVHACNFVLKVLDRKEPGARVWPNWCHNYYTPKLPFFKISVYLPAFLYNFHTYNIIYFSHQMIKVIWEKFGLLRLHALSKLVGGGGAGRQRKFFKGAKLFKIPSQHTEFFDTPPPPPPLHLCSGLSIMSQILNLSVASKKNGIPLPAFRNFYHPPLFPSKLFKTLPKKIPLFLFENLVPITEHKWWYNNLFTRCLKYDVSRHSSTHYFKHGKSPYFVRPICFTFTT